MNLLMKERLWPLPSLARQILQRRLFAPAHGYPCPASSDKTARPFTTRNARPRQHGALSACRKSSAFSTNTNRGLRSRSYAHGVGYFKKGFYPFFKLFPGLSLLPFVRLRAPCFRKARRSFSYSILANQARRASPPHRVRDRANTTAAMVRYRFLFMTT